MRTLSKCLMLISLLIFHAYSGFAENLSLSTYYPVTRGVYLNEILRLNYLCQTNLQMFSYG